MKNLLLTTTAIFIFLSIVVPIRLHNTTPTQCGPTGSCIANPTIGNTSPIVTTRLYPSVIAYIIDIKDRNNYPYPSLVKSDIVRNEIIIAILAIGIALVINRTKKSIKR